MAYTKQRKIKSMSPKPLKESREDFIAAVENAIANEGQEPETQVGLTLRKQKSGKHKEQQSIYDLAVCWTCSKNDPNYSSDNHKERRVFTVITGVSGCKVCGDKMLIYRWDDESANKLSQ